MALHLSDLTNIPTKPWVYLFSDERGKILYIGKAKNLKNRLTQYFQKWSVRKQDMLHHAAKVEFHIVTTESEALFLEDNLIKKHLPQYNNLLKADNSYAYIKITNEQYPQIFLTRFRDRDGATYIGPKNNTKYLREMLHFFRQLFQYRGCKKTQFNEGKLCSDYFFGLCEGRCVYNKLSVTSDESSTANKFLAEAARLGFEPKYTHEESQQQYRKILALLSDFFSGKTKTLKDYIMQSLEDAVQQQHFEYAAKIRDMYTKVDLLTERQNVVLSRPVTGNIVLVKPIGEWRVCCLIKLYEWKIIDIIRYKQHHNDGEISSLLSSFQREVGELKRSSRDGKSTDPIADILTVDQWLADNTALLWVQADQRILQDPLREIIAQLERSIDAYVLTSAFEKDNLINELLKTVETRYGLKKFPYSMECLDISHLSGGRVSGGLSAMKEGLPNKKWYRRYKVKGKKITKDKLLTESDESRIPHESIMIQSDDYASLEEVLTRRFALHLSHCEDLFLPDLFILDGGKGQLGILKDLYASSETFREIYEKVQFVSLGKWEARERRGKNKWAKEKIYMFDSNFRIVEKDLCYDDADRILLQLRDEAHRFANAYRQKQMSGEWKTVKKIAKKKGTNYSSL